MATLAFAAAGAVVGGALMPAGLTVLGATLSGATLGSQLGALSGAFVDQALFASSGQSRPVAGPRLKELAVTTSTEGAPIPRLYGQARLGGQVIWARDIEEEVVAGESGGGGGKGAPRQPASDQTEYRYFASFAVALAEGEVTSLGRVWADGHELELSEVNFRFYRGTAFQQPDGLIEAVEGSGNAPAFRGVAYVVFERLPLAPYGNRLPQLTFEVSRATDDLHKRIQAVVLIPGSGEFVYATQPVTRWGGNEGSVAENVHNRQALTDWHAAIDQLEAQLPNARSVSLVVSWFADDLRAGSCRIRPGVDRLGKQTTPISWRVAGLGRSEAHVVSTVDGRPAYGGTPSDATVVAAIRDLKARGFRVTLNPFLLMDVPPLNTRIDPYTGAIGQPAYPWRGRITVSPAAGAPDTVDKTSAAALQLAAFAGSAAPMHFSLAGEAVAYGGPAEWSYRRFILHYAKLAVAAGGVDAFLIGSELRGLTTARSAAAAYPFVDALVALASDVRSIVGTATRITYAADWSEYFGHHPADGSGDVLFHLDPLWAAEAIDAVGIDCYWPLSDWRPGSGHLDRVSGARSVYDLDYLKSNLVGGEGYDWHYANDDDRRGQHRTLITDGAAGKPWVFRYKDLRSWWLEPHVNRVAGVELPSATAWIPQSKPIWLMEVGCPAVDNGANQPNVFVDPKSSESVLPYFSNGLRDDLMQRRYLQAVVEAFDASRPEGVEGLNPLSAIYGGPMVPADRIHIYAWDARPYPAFPRDVETWGDGGNWRCGHWIQGRLAQSALDQTVRTVLADHGFGAHDVGGLAGMVPGYVIDRVMSARDALQPLELAYFFDSIESGGKIRFRHRGAEGPASLLETDHLVEAKPDMELLAVTRAQESDLPASAKVAFLSLSADYRQGVAEARRLAGASGRVAQAELPLVLEPDQATAIAETWLFETWVSRERARFSLPPSRIAVEPGDVLRLATSSGGRDFRVTEIGDHGVRDIEALSIDPDLYVNTRAPDRPPPRSAAVPSGQPSVEWLDLPLLRPDEPPASGYIAVGRQPWPGAIAVYRAPEPAGFELAGIVRAPSPMGITLNPLPAGPISRLDRANRVQIRIESGMLTSVTPLQLLGGANAAAVGDGEGPWEIMQFGSASLVAPGVYELSRLLRGQAGTEHAIRPLLAVGSRFVLLTPALLRADISLDEIGVPFRWRIGPAMRDLGHPDYREEEHAFRGVGLKPLAPVHVRGRRNGGDLTISWVRRTRTGGDAWELAEVPLAEDAERYDVEILDESGSVLRVITTPEPRADYTAAAQSADFASLPEAIAVRVYQRSAVAGRGYPAAVVV